MFPPLYVLSAVKTGSSNLFITWDNIKIITMVTIAVLGLMLTWWRLKTQAVEAHWLHHCSNCVTLGKSYDLSVP